MDNFIKVDANTFFYIKDIYPYPIEMNWFMDWYDYYDWNLAKDYKIGTWEAADAARVFRHFNYADLDDYYIREDVYNNLNNC